MKTILLLVGACLFTLSCNKQTVSPVTPPKTTPGFDSAALFNMTPEGNYPSAITVFVNHAAMPVTAIKFNRSTGSFNFSAQNKLQKVDVNCFWFYQQSRWSFQYSDSINYSVRPDTLSDWYTRRAITWGDVYFDCCDAPLTDSLVEGGYSANFGTAKDSLIIDGRFHLVF